MKTSPWTTFPKHVLLAAVGLMLTLFTQRTLDAQTPPFRVLVFSATAGYRHASITNGIETIRMLGATNNFLVDTTEDAAQFTDTNLAQYQVVACQLRARSGVNAAPRDAPVTASPGLSG